MLVWNFDVISGRKEIYGPPLAQFDSMNRHRLQVSCRYHSGCEDCQWGFPHMITKHPKTIPENMCSVLKLHLPLDLAAMALSMISRHDYWNAWVLCKEIKLDNWNMRKELFQMKMPNALCILFQCCQVEGSIELRQLQQELRGSGPPVLPIMENLN